MADNDPNKVVQFPGQQRPRLSVDWATLVVSLVLSIGGGVEVTSYEMGKYSARIEISLADQKTMAAKIDTFNSSATTLSVGIAALTSRVDELKEAMTTERQDRLDTEHRDLILRQNR
jgi:hypothetical protein